MSGTIKFFDYYQRPKYIFMDTTSLKDITLKKQEQLKKYEQLYKDKFCKAFNIKCTDIDLRGFLYLVQKRILERFNPEGVDFRPSGSMIRLYITPQKASMKLGILSYDNHYDYEKEFKKFQELTAINPKKSEGLESIIK